MENTNQDMMPFDLPKNRSSVIKVVGVGGGGSNAVNHMFSSGINGVDFVICNTDAQALENSPVPNKIQLGVTLTEGLGAGANPTVGEQAAKESLDEITKVLETNTKMVFITAGMGGGTGTGAAPVIAKAARDQGILTVGIVTSPFVFEGRMRQEQAEKGIDSLRSVVDSLVVINNNKLREVYGNLGFKAGFAKADEVLATAARGIAEVITHHYTTNIDLRDAKTVLANSGTAIMGAATAMGENRAKEAISAALDSPLLNDNHIRGAKNVLLLIVSGTNEITIDEIGEVNDFIQNEAGGAANIIMGIGEDESLGDEISITIIATGFNADQQKQVIGKAPAKIVHPLEDDQAISTSLYDAPVKMDEEDLDHSLDQELDRALSEEKELERQRQTSLFADDDYDKPLHPTAQPIEDQNDSPSAEEEEEGLPRFELKEEEELVIEDHPMFELDKDSEPEEEIEAEEPVLRHTLEMEEEETNEVKEPASNPQAEVQEEDIDFNFFQIDIDEEEEVEAPRMEIHEKAPEQEIPQAKAPEKPETDFQKPAPAERKVFSLEDYQELEAKLNQGISPKATGPKPAPQAKAEADKDEDLHFEVKTRQEEAPAAKRQGPLDPMESSIEESMRLRAEERRAKLKAFNYRFKNNPHSLTETDNEPAYKRHGINIEQRSLSSQESRGRMTLNDGEEGPNFKSNNSFLHDNVD
ncbi:cell division protein FtsZ [Croceimicrobium sp.]|uniref:cell division protein FtsZ n=1 Tax=Croceimicrobium sp. TaxID=2828340 RepID=UPI003BAD197D